MERTDRDLESFENMVAACDWEAIEAWRQRVRPEHVGHLTALYDRVGSWEQRCAVLQLLQDKMVPAVRQRMHHFLAAPPGNDENFELTKATALCHLESDFELFMTYYEDRKKLAADVAAWRAKPCP